MKNRSKSSPFCNNSDERYSTSSNLFIPFKSAVFLPTKLNITQTRRYSTRVKPNSNSDTESMVFLSTGDELIKPSVPSNKSYSFVLSRNHSTRMSRVQYKFAFINEIDSVSRRTLNLIGETRVLDSVSCFLIPRLEGGFLALHAPHGCPCIPKGGPLAIYRCILVPVMHY